jgi:hypothetical protein
LAVPETAEAEMAPMFKEIATGKPTTEGSAAAAIASLGQLATLVGARIVEHASLVAARKPIATCEVVSTLRSAPGETLAITREVAILSNVGIPSDSATPSKAGGTGWGSGGVEKTTS